MQNIIQNNLNILQKLIKYILICIVVVVTVIYIPENKLKNKEIIMIGATASISFAILDMISPTIKINKNTYQDSSKILVEEFTPI